MDLLALFSKLQDINTLQDEGERERAVSSFNKAFPQYAMNADALPAAAVPSGEGLRKRAKAIAWVGEDDKVWQNCVANQSVRPLRIVEPTTLDEIKKTITEAEAIGARVHAAATGHSYSDIMLTEDLLVDVTKMTGALPLDTSVLRPTANPATLHEFRAGTTITELNDTLETLGLALPNMGGYTGQTFVGAAATATHGSGVTLAPICDIVESLTLVAGGSRVFRVEPAAGITDAAAFTSKHPDITLIQDDQTYNALLVSLGCMGVIYSVVIRAQARYWLREERVLSTWPQVKAALAPKADGSLPDALTKNRHYEVLVNPYATKKDSGFERRCLVTKRNLVPAPPHQKPVGHRDWLAAMMASSHLVADALILLLNTFPKLAPGLINDAMETMVDTYADISYKVLDLGAANDMPAYSTEVAFPWQNAAVAAERVFEVASTAQVVGDQYYVSPVSLRFTAPSRAYLAMQHQTTTCMIEVPGLVGIHGGYETMGRYERAMYDLGGRPHWGLQFDHIGGGRDLIATMYPDYPTWQTVRDQFDPRGTFHNDFTQRVGISAPPYSRA